MASPSNTAADVLIKINDYFGSGVRLVWAIYPVQEQCYAYDSPRSVRILGKDDSLGGGAVLPGFRIPLSELFAESEEEANAAPQPPAASPE